MSEIRMCDNCGNIFSVNQKGWTEYTKKTNDYRENNSFNHGAQTMHMGSCCAAGNTGPVTPRVMMLETADGTIIDA